MAKKYNKIVLAYSGGLDTSVLIPWLKENYGCEVIAVSADVGQGAELDGLEEKGVQTPATMYRDTVVRFVSPPSSPPAYK